MFMQPDSPDQLPAKHLLLNGKSLQSIVQQTAKYAMLACADTWNFCSKAGGCGSGCTSDKFGPNSDATYVRCCLLDPA